MVAIPDLQNLMVDVNNIQAMTTIIRELAYSKLAFPRGIREHDSGSSSTVLQQRSQEATVRIPGYDRVQEFRGGRGENVHLYDRQGSWQRGTFVLDQECARPRNDELLGQTTNEESLGDVVEMVLGFF